MVRDLLLGERSVTVTVQPTTNSAIANHFGALQLFLYLQVLDLVTTLVGFRLGASELSPFVRWLTEIGPATGVLLSKVVAVGLAAFCVITARYRTIRLINYWYAGLVLWNLGILLLLR
jgi:hypothetical protein